MSIPYTWGFVVLCAVQATAVLGPRPSPVVAALRAHRALGLIPLAAIGGVVVAIGAQPSLAQDATDLAAIATPIAALAGLVAFRDRIRVLALAAPAAYLVAWKGHGPIADIAVDLLIVGACASLAWLTGIVAPRAALAVGIVVATIVDVYQVLVAEDVQVVAQALHAAAPVARLPRLQEALYDGATMGWGDVYLAALLGVVAASAPLVDRFLAAAATFLGGLVLGFGFVLVDTLPATVPVAVALGLVLLRERSRQATLQRSEGGSFDGNDDDAPR